MNHEPKDEGSMTKHQLADLIMGELSRRPPTNKELTEAGFDMDELIAEGFEPLSAADRREYTDAKMTMLKEANNMLAIVKGHAAAHTLDEIASVTNITSEGVRQVEQRVINNFHRDPKFSEDMKILKDMKEERDERDSDHHEVFWKTGSSPAGDWYDGGYSNEGSLSGTDNVSILYEQVDAMEKLDKNPFEGIKSSESFDETKDG